MTRLDPVRCASPGPLLARRVGALGCAERASQVHTTPLKISAAAAHRCVGR